MRKDKIIAINLRKQGNSYNQIRQKLNVPKSTLSYWLSDLTISRNARKKIQKRVFQGSIQALIKRNKNQTILARERADKIINNAKIESIKLINKKLFLVGIALYWAEGYKKGAYGSKWKAVDFANSDPELIKIMIKFFKSICQVKSTKIKMQLIAHKNLDINKTINYWSKLTTVPKAQFIKTYAKTSRSSKNIRNKYSLTHGTVHIRINDVRLFFRIIGWIEGIKKII